MNEVEEGEPGFRKPNMERPQHLGSICSTPVTAAQTSLGMVQSIDSGFAESPLWPPSTGSLTSASTPASIGDNGKVVENSSFEEMQQTPTHKPILQKRSVRRLQFNVFEERPPSFQLLGSCPNSPDSHLELDLDKTKISFSDGAEKKTDNDKNIEKCESEPEQSMSAQKNSPSIDWLKVYKRRSALPLYLSSGSSSLSSSTDDLELSMQEMSLEESSSSSSMMSLGSPSNLVRAQSVSPSLETQFPHARRLSDPSTEVAVMSGKSSPVTDRNRKSEARQEQLEFLKTLSLTHKKAPLPEEQPQAWDCSSHGTDMASQSISLSQPSTSQTAVLSQTDARVPLLPHQYFLFDNLSPAEEATDNEEDMVYSPGYHFNLPSKSPTKRCNNSDRDLLLLHSPSKARRKQFFDVDSSSSVQLKTPEKVPIVSCKSEYNQSKARSLGKSLVERLNSCEAERSPQFYNIGLPHPTRRSIRHKKSKKDVSKSSVKKQHSVGIEKVKKHFDLSESSKLVGEEHGASVWNIQQSMLLNDRLERVIKEFSPSEPSRLIGRHIGLIKFDILGELKSRNFVLITQKVLYYLEDADLMRVVQVSSHWKSVVLDDPKASYRYTDLVRAHQLRTQGLGKENEIEKTVDRESTREAFTPSKGHLTSKQLRAVVPFNLDAACAVPPKPTLDLLSGDQLRHCPKCHSLAKILPHQDRATCTSEKCGFDFCTSCFTKFHFSQACKPLCRALSKNEVAGTRKSKKNLKRL